MWEPNSVTVHPTVVETFHQNPHAILMVAREESDRLTLKLVGYILWGTRMCKIVRRSIL